ncbi:hypothetical protein OY671_011445, partial [Metschnikowia pulcherrima]
MAFIYCNTMSRIVKTCSSQRCRRAILVGILAALGQAARASVPSVFPGTPESQLEVGDSEGVYKRTTENLDKTKKQSKEKTEQAEKSVADPGNTDAAAKIKAIDESIGAKVQEGVKDAAQFPKSGSIQGAVAALVIQSG